MVHDRIKDLFAEIRSLVPDSSNERLLQVEARFRQNWGGSRVYVAKDPAFVKRVELFSAIAGGVNGSEARSNLQISRTHAHRLLRSR